MNRSNKIIDVARNKRCYGGILFVFVYSFGCWPRNIFFVKWGWWWLDIVLVSFIRWCTICFAFLQRGFLSYSSYFISFFKIFIKEEKNSLIHTLTHLCGKSLTLLYFGLYDNRKMLGYLRKSLFLVSFLFLIKINNKKNLTSEPGRLLTTADNLLDCLKVEPTKTHLTASDFMLHIQTN